MISWPVVYLLKRNVTSYRQMVAGLAGKVCDGAALRDRAEAPAADEVEAEGKNPITGENVVTDGSGNVFAVFDGGKID